MWFIVYINGNGWCYISKRDAPKNSIWQKTNIQAEWLPLWTSTVRVIRDTLVANCFLPEVSTAHCIAYHPPIEVSIFLLAMLLRWFQWTPGHCGDLWLYFRMSSLGTRYLYAGASGQRAHGQFSLTPLTGCLKEFGRKSGFGSKRVGCGWESMIQPYCYDPRHVRQSEWIQMLHMMECVIHCIKIWDDMRWHEMILDKIQEVINLRLASREYVLPIGQPSSISPASPYSHHPPLVLHHPCISVYPPQLSPLPSQVVADVRKGYSRYNAFASGLQWDGWGCDNLSLNFLLPTHIIQFSIYISYTSFHMAWLVCLMTIHSSFRLSPLSLLVAISEITCAQPRIFPTLKICKAMAASAFLTCSNFETQSKFSEFWGNEVNSRANQHPTKAASTFSHLICNSCCSCHEISPCSVPSNLPAWDFTHTHISKM